MTTLLALQGLDLPAVGARIVQELHVVARIDCFVTGGERLSMHLIGDFGSGDKSESGAVFCDLVSVFGEHAGF